MPRRIVVDPRFGLRMRELREQRGLSLRALAHHVHYGHSQVHAFEKGTQRPTVEMARCIDEALGAGGELASLVTTVDATRRRR